MTQPRGCYPLVSIAITSYNYGQYIGRAIASAQAQNYPNLEILVSDNASTDGSVEVIAELARSDERTRYWVNKRNIGAHANFTLVREACKGEYIAFLSADDIFYPGYVSSAMLYYAEHPECDLRHTAWTHIDEEGRTIMVCPHPGNRGMRSISARDEFAYGLTTSGHVRFQTVVWPKRIFEAIGEFNVDVLAADTEYLFRCARAGVTFAYDTQPYVGLMQHPKSASSRENFRDTGQQLHEWLTLYHDNLLPETMTRLVGTRRRASLVIENAVRYVQGLPEPKPSEILARENALLVRVREKLAGIPERLDATHAPDPRFSVVLPTMGRMGMLRRSINSVAAQSLGSWEIIVVGNSGRNVECVIRDSPFRDRIVYAETLETDSASKARNLALRVARGETIAYLDEGDSWSPNYLEHVTAALDRHGADIVRCASTAGFYEVFEREQTRLVERDDSFFAPPGKPFVDDLGLYAPLSSIAHRKYCYEEIGEFNENLLLLEDWEYVLRLVGAGRFAIVDAGGALAMTAYNRSLLFQALGTRLFALVDSLNAVFGAIGTSGPQTAEARSARVNEIVAAANALLANRNAFEGVKGLARALHGYRTV